ncbi:MAG: ABC transporter substrate-binding protein [Actinobacteria bacterium]|nr:ABC transporter substrate-binding protein [Actinomycetota bacterium]
MKSVARFLLVTLVLAVGSLTLAACSDDDDGGGGGDSSAEGGSITISQSSQPDYLDPALSYTVNGWEPMWLVYTPLITYKRAEGAEGSELIPGLAEDLPEISSDGLTYTLKLRDGLVYSDGTPVKASDFEHTIARVLNLESGGSFFYEAIEGADKYLSGGDPEADISGIEADDKTGEITVTLVEPDASFSNVLAMNFAGLVPGDTPFRNLTEDPPPGVGPYELTSSEPNREFVMEKSKTFEGLGIPEIPAGNIDTITTKIIPNAQQQAQDVIDNKLDYMQDNPPADLLPQIKERFEGSDAPDGERFEEHTTVSTYYFFLNVREEPFDDPKVREAVNVGLDRPALARLYGGTLAPGCGFLPPGMPGHNESLDGPDCPFGDPNQPPDLERAQQLLKEAGAEGAKVTVWGNTDDPTPKVTEAYADQLDKIGFDVDVRILGAGVYFQAIGNEDTRAQTGFTNWFQDFPHPLNFYFLVDGGTIQPTNNQNFSNVDDLKINDEINALALETDLASVEDSWAALDEVLVADNSYIAPYGHQKQSTFFSDRMDFSCALFNPLYLNDYSSWCLKEGE